MDTVDAVAKALWEEDPAGAESTWRSWEDAGEFEREKRIERQRREAEGV